MSLVCDDRDAAVTQYIRGKKNVEVKRLVNGDFAIFVGVRLVAIFERKSLSDFGASILDGRTANKVNLLRLRGETGCQIYYLIEGPTNPNPKTEFGRVSYSAIESSFTHLETQFAINIIRTTNAHHTAQKLLRMRDSFLERAAFNFQITRAIQGGWVEFDADSIEIKNDTERGKICIMTKAKINTDDDNSLVDLDKLAIADVYDVDTGLNHQTLLDIKTEQTAEQKRMPLWLSLPKIGPASAVKMVTRPAIEYFADTKLLDQTNLGPAQMGSIRALWEKAWNIEQRNFVGAMEGVGSKRLGELLAKYTCFMDACGCMGKKGSEIILRALRV